MTYFVENFQLRFAALQDVCTPHRKAVRHHVQVDLVFIQFLTPISFRHFKTCAVESSIVSLQCSVGFNLFLRRWAALATEPNGTLPSVPTLPQSAVLPLNDTQLININNFRLTSIIHPSHPFKVQVKILK